MPTYEYRCPDGHRFELFQRMSDPAEAGCPECGAAAERLLSAGAGFLFKGDGFYITDYRSESYKKAAASDSGGGEGEKKDTPAGKGSDTSGSSKPADAKPGAAKSSGKSSSGEGGKASPGGGASAG